MTRPTTSRGPDPGDENRLGPTRVRDLAGIAVVAGLVMWILIRYNYGDFPSLPWPAGLTLVVLAVIEVIIGFVVRARVASRKVGPVHGQLHPIHVARLTALAKASSILGAIALGGWLGVAVFVWSNSELAAAQADRPAVIVGAVGGLILIGAALWLEYCCRAPDDPEPTSTDSAPSAPEPA